MTDDEIDIDSWGQSTPVEKKDEKPAKSKPRKTVRKADSLSPNAPVANDRESQVQVSNRRREREEETSGNANEMERHELKPSGPNTLGLVQMPEHQQIYHLQPGDIAHNHDSLSDIAIGNDGCPSNVSWPVPNRETAISRGFDIPATLPVKILTSKVLADIIVASKLDIEGEAMFKKWVIRRYKGGSCHARTIVLDYLIEIYRQLKHEGFE